MKRFHTAVFGTGFVGRVHLEAIRRLGFVDVTAIGVSQPAKAHRLAEELHVARAEADFHKIMADPTVDAVHICTPNAIHFPMAEAALEAGKHVLSEKPLAVSAAEAQKLVALAQQKK